jgi:hypothetical protein
MVDQQLCNLPWLDCSVLSQLCDVQNIYRSVNLCLQSCLALWVWDLILSSWRPPAASVPLSWSHRTAVSKLREALICEASMHIFYVLSRSPLFSVPKNKDLEAGNFQLWCCLWHVLWTGHCQFGTVCVKRFSKTSSWVRWYRCLRFLCSWPPQPSVSSLCAKDWVPCV